jgi:drug/metabolite transporter (DMT)-like permease
VSAVETLPFALVMVSAVSHPLWNLLAKGADDKESFMVLLNLAALALFLPVFLVVLPDLSLPLEVVPFLSVSAAAETVYYLALGRAYEGGDMSVVYPVARSSPVFVTVAAALLLGETITPWGLVGILVIFVGVYTLHLRGLGSAELLQPVRRLGEPASRYALAAALGTTVYSIADKMGVTAVAPLRYAFWMVIFNTGLLTAVTLLRRGTRGVVAEAHRRPLRAAAAGFLMTGGYILVLVAMSMTQVSYTLALRQASVVLGALMGVTILGERHRWIRVASSAVIFLGVYILGVLA